MSEQPTDSTGDWRRRGRRGRRSRTGSPAGAETQGASVAANDAPNDAETADAEEVEVASRTLFSFLEPSLNTIGTFGAPLVIAGIVALVVGITLVAFVSSMRLYGFIIIAFGAALIGLVGLIFLSSVVAAFISRTGRYGVNSLIMLAAFLGIVIIANFVSFENNNRIDVTATNQFSLAERTRQLLDELEQEVEVVAFYKEEISLGPQGNADAAFQILNRQNKVSETFREFEAARPSKFDATFVDPDVSPQRVNQYFGTTPIAFVNESIVVKLKGGDVVDVIQPQDAAYSHLEQDLVSGILQVTGQEQKAIYFMSGHGERNINTQESDAEGYSSVRSGLEQDNYRVDAIRWGLTNDDVSVPEDTALLVIARPTDELPESHAQALHLYLQGKNTDGSARQAAGRLIYLADPETPDSFREFLATWGVVVGQGYIRDVDASLPADPHTLRLETINPLELPRELIASIPPEILETLLEITTPKGDSLDLVLMPGTAPLQTIDDGTGLRQPIPLAFTSVNSYLIGDSERTEPRPFELEDGNQVCNHSEDCDPSGPFTPVTFVRALGPVGQPPPADPSSITESQIANLVVVGDSDFVANSFYGRGSGADLFLNSANYLVGDYSLVSLRPKAITVREFNLDKNEFNFVRFSSWLFLPVLMGLMAALVWWVRR